MLSWATKRRFIYLAAAAGVLLIIFSAPIISFFTKPPLCSDNKQNGGEAGIDCGGSCPTLCDTEVADVVIFWNRFLPVGDGRYDAVALLENPNPEGVLPGFAYSFQLYDEKNILIVERTGVSFVNPRERFAIYEANIKTGERVPKRSTFQIIGKDKWLRADGEIPEFKIENKQFQSNGGKPKLTARISNESLFDAEDVSIVALLYDEEDNVVGAGKTVIDRLRERSSKDIIFIWPQPLTGNPVRIEILPRTRSKTSL